MNGILLPRDHGFPVRALVSGFAGPRNCKWIKEVSLDTYGTSMKPWQLSRHWTAPVYIYMFRLCAIEEFIEWLRYRLDAVSWHLDVVACRNHYSLLFLVICSIFAFSLDLHGLKDGLRLNSQQSMMLSNPK
eukprot:478810_1